MSNICQASAMSGGDFKIAVVSSLLFKLTVNFVVDGISKRLVFLSEGIVEGIENCKRNVAGSRVDG